MRTRRPSKSDVDAFLRICRKRPGFALAGATYLRAVSRPVSGGIQIHKQRLGRLLVLARKGNVAARAAARTLAAQILDGGAALPEALNDYIVADLKKLAPARRGAGRDPYANDIRDHCILYAVLRVMKDGGFAITRNRATVGRESACSLATAALAELGIHLSESAVEKIVYEQLRRLQLRPSP
jgi:hypothetical protein